MWDLNPHGVIHRNLNPACLPIPSIPQKIGAQCNLISHCIPVLLSALRTMRRTKYSRKQSYHPKKPLSTFFSDILDYLMVDTVHKK